MVCAVSFGIDLVVFFLICVDIYYCRGRWCLVCGQPAKRRLAGPYLVLLDCLDLGHFPGAPGSPFVWRRYRPGMGATHGGQGCRPAPPRRVAGRAAAGLYPAGAAAAAGTAADSAGPRL